MTFPVVFRRVARSEFDEAASWYEERRPGLGEQFVAEIDRAVQLAAKDPLRYSVVFRDVRCIRARRFPYSVFYRAESQRVVVLAVFHASRDPESWQRRA
jgi:toxin ParE1/3/4